MARIRESCSSDTDDILTLGGHEFVRDRPGRVELLNAAKVSGDGLRGTGLSLENDSFCEVVVRASSLRLEIPVPSHCTARLAESSA